MTLWYAIVVSLHPHQSPAKGWPPEPWCPLVYFLVILPKTLHFPSKEPALAILYLHKAGSPLEEPRAMMPLLDSLAGNPTWQPFCIGTHYLFSKFPK